MGVVRLLPVAWGTQLALEGSAAPDEFPRPEPKVRPKRLPGWKAPAVVPKHVQHCNRGRGSRDWWIYTWRPDVPEYRIRVPYSCNSWRCEACAPHEAAVLFRRITDACKPLDPKGFVFLVLTLDQRGYFDKRSHGWREFRDVREAYRELGRQSEKLLKRVRRWQEREGMKPLGSQWFAVVEAHRSGWPHMNLVVYSPELAESLEREQRELKAAGKSPRECILLRGELLEAAVGAGWGVQSTAERARSREALAGYVTKLAGFSDATAGEVAKITQAPTSAPQRFRRLRSGKGFLPPRKGTADGWTGALVRRQVCNDGVPVVLPLHRCSAEHSENVRDACELEDQIWQDERETLYRKRSIVARHGPEAVLGRAVTYWDGKKQSATEPVPLFGKGPDPVLHGLRAGNPAAARAAARALSVLVDALTSTSATDRTESVQDRAAARKRRGEAPE